ncbi:MAG: hypothetical protein MUF04_01530 [Akkermansiaceae bacterium]|nr:hypothetical protein [Akkermansiaceae bacterium]
MNLLPVLRGEQQEIRDWLHFEHAPCYSSQQAFHALTGGGWKYIWCPHDGRELRINLKMAGRTASPGPYHTVQPEPGGFPCPRPLS